MAKEKRRSLKYSAEHSVIVVGGLGFHVEFSLSTEAIFGGTIGFLTVVTLVGHKLSLEHDILDTDIEDHYTIPVCGPAGGGHTIHMRTTAHIGVCPSQELLCPNEKEKKKPRTRC